MSKQKSLQSRLNTDSDVDVVTSGRKLFS